MRLQVALIGATTLMVAACASASTPPSPSSTSQQARTVDTSTTGTPTSSLPAGPSALEDSRNPAFPDPLIDPAEIIHGGPPPDGIPPIDAPKFRSIAEADSSLADSEAVIVLDVNGDARAYPVEILIWHEIVNDTVGGVPVVITYCPLCNSAVTYVREIRGVETTFGTSGRLYASALVMYDRATESLWTHFDGRAVVGVLTGERLDPVPSPLLAWSAFVEAYPNGKVLSRDTGFLRDYGRNPYFGYDNPDTSPFLFIGSVDERARAKQRVVGVAIGDDAVAFSLDAVSGGEARATNTTVGETAIAIFWQSGQVSALEGADTSKGRDIGSVGVFLPTLDSRPLTFETRGSTFVDLETGSAWDITGAAISGELAGSQLARIHHLDTFWFAWSTYRPGTILIEG